jgi:hypothetical protein
MADHNSDEESSDSDAASQEEESSHSSASSYSRQSSSRSAASSREEGSSADASSRRSVTSSRSAASTQSAASTRSSRSRSSSRSSHNRSPHSSVASRSGALSFDIEDAAEGVARIELEENNNQQRNTEQHTHHDEDEDDSVSSGPPTSASNSREGSRSPFTEAEESHHSRSELSSKGGDEGIIILNEMNMNGHSSSHSSTQKQNHQHQNGGPIFIKPTPTKTAAASARTTKEKGKRVPANDVVIGSTIEMPTISPDTKFIKIKLIDPTNHDNNSTAEPIYITLAIDIPTSQEPLWSNIDSSVVGMGQTIQMSFIENDDQGTTTALHNNNKRMELWHDDELGRERVKKETDKILSEVVEELSPEDVIQRKQDTIQTKKQPQQKQQHNASPPEEHTISSSIGPPPLKRQTSEGLQSVAHSVESLPTPEKGLEPFTIPSLITSTATKSDPSQKVGLAFRKTGGVNTVIIDKIAPGSPFEGSDLRSGHEILCINGHRVRSARRAAEIVRESRDSLTLVVSNAIRPPGTMYTMVSIADHRHQDVSSLGRKNNYVAGMYFKMKNGLVQLMKVDEDSPVVATSMKVGDFILAVNGKVAGSIFKVVDAFVDSAKEEFFPVLYFNMRNLRVSLVDTNIGDRWRQEWSDYYDECTILSPGSPGSTPLILRFKEDGMCELVDPLHKTNGKPAVITSPDNPLQPVVEAINYGTICLLSAIREGVKIASSSTTNGRKVAIQSPHRSRSEEVKQRGNDKLAEMFDVGLLNEDDFRAIKSKLVASKLVE